MCVRDSKREIEKNNGKSKLRIETVINQSFKQSLLVINLEI